MLDPTKLPLFLLSALILLLTPGPAVLYIITRSIDQGRLAGLVSVLSIEVGNFMHVLAATLGLSALVLTSAMGFTIIKNLGAGYLIYLGVRRFINSKQHIDTRSSAEGGLRKIFSQGILVAALNPKTALFFLAFLPQFVNPSTSSIPLQFFILGCIFVMMAIVTDGLYALLASTARIWLKSNRSFWWVERYIAGTVYIALGLTAAFTGSSHK